MKAFFHTHRHLLIFYSAMFVLFLWPLLTLKEAFLFGDYRVQVLPWMKTFADALSDGRLPYWTSQMAGGYPLLAEGQVAAYYPVHWLLHLLLPFRAAYTWSVPIHILIGSAGMYLYLRRLGSTHPAAALGSIVFSFSSLYGGNFYVIATLRTLCWLPWLLWVAEPGDQKDRPKGSLAFLGAASLTYFIWNGGFAQLALYALGYTALYALLRFAGQWKRLVWVFSALAAGTVLSAPQLAATRELIGLSTRASSDLSFALWGSVPPPALSSFIFPEWGRILRVSLYMGILPLMLAAAGILAASRSGWARAHTILAGLFILLALGKYNPLYVWMLKTLELHLLRTPSKFLFFAVFSLIPLAALGLDSLRQGPLWQKRSKPAALLFGSILIVSVLAPASGWWMRGPGSGFLESWGERQAVQIHSEKTDPLYTTQEYAGRMQDVIRSLTGALDHRNPWVIYAIAGMVLSLWLMRRLAARDPGRSMTLLFIFVCADLLIFGQLWGTGFTGNARPWQDVPHPAIERLKTLQTNHGGLAVEWVSASGREILPPNENMRWGLSHAGGYTPLLLGRYHEAMKDYGFSDASTGRKAFDEDTWRKGWGLLDAMGVSWVLSDRALPWDQLTPVDQVGERWIYRNDGAMPDLYAIDSWRTFKDAPERLKYLHSPLFDPHKEAVIETEGPSPGNGAGLVPIAWEQAEDGTLTFECESATDTLVVFRRPVYPRWTLLLDGVRTPVIPVDHLSSGVFLTSGRHEGVLAYDASFHRRWESFALWGWLLLTAGCLWLSRGCFRREDLGGWAAGVWFILALTLYWAAVILPKWIQVTSS